MSIVLQKRPILIAGPTASGKSSLAIAIARKTDGIIINADSLQVYANWRVLTARPSGDELSQAPHVLYGHVERDQEYSVGHWINDVQHLLVNTHKTPVIVGGTGLYFGALLNGLSKIPAIPAEVRNESNRLVKNEGIAWFRTYLSSHDPETYAKLDQNNPARLQRAYEVLEATGHGLSYWHAHPTRPIIEHEETTPILLNWNVNNLNDRIDTRFSQMVGSGAIEECEKARQDGFDPKLPSNRAIGAREIIDALEGKTSMEDAIEKSKTLTHQYAKKQRTWFRSKMKNWMQVEMTPETDLGQLLDSVLK